MQTFAVLEVGEFLFHFSEGFENQCESEFFFFRVREDGSLVTLENRHEVVDHVLLPFVIEVELQYVEPDFRVVLPREYLLVQVAVVGQCIQHSCKLLATVLFAPPERTREN